MSRPSSRRWMRVAAVALLAYAGTVTGVRADDSAFTSFAGIGNATGEQIYTHICQGCHMSQAQGAVGAGHYPKLAGDPALVSWQYAAITVLNGKNGMPPFGLSEADVMETRAVHLSDAQVAAVVNYVRSNFGNKYKANVKAKDVASLPHPGNKSAPRDD